MKILVFGGGLQALSFGESFYNQPGYELSIAADGYDVCKSRFFKNVYKVSHDDYDKSLDAILSNAHYDVVVPMGDASATYLSKNKERIETCFHTKCAVADFSILEMVADKSQFMQFCQDYTFPHPKTYPLTDTNLLQAAEQVGFPALIKPDHSVGARGITKVCSIEELEANFTKISRDFGSCTLQEFIDNPDYYYNVMMYRDSDGSCSHYAITKIVRKYPLGAGSSSCCVSIEDKKLAAICERVLQQLNWRGLADFDVLQRKDTMDYKIIEINPRVPASLRAAYISGIDFPAIIVNDLLGKELPHYEYKPGKILRYMGLDLMWLMKSKRLFGNTPSWLRFFGKNVFYQDIVRKDPSTWYSWIVTGINKIRYGH